MSYYNDSLFDTGNTYYDLTLAVNTATNNMYASIIILGCLFIITFSILKFRQNSNAVSFVYSGVLTTFIAGMLFYQNMITFNVLMIWTIVTGASILIFKLADE